MCCQLVAFGFIFMVAVGCHFVVMFVEASREFSSRHCSSTQLLRLAAWPCCLRPVRLVVCFSVRLSVCLPFCPSGDLSAYLPSVRRVVYLLTSWGCCISLCLLTESVYGVLRLAICLSESLFAWLFLEHSVWSVCMFTRSSVPMWVCLSARLSVFLPACVSVPGLKGIWTERILCSTQITRRNGPSDPMACRSCIIGVRHTRGSVNMYNVMYIFKMSQPSCLSLNVITTCRLSMEHNYIGAYIIFVAG